MNVGDLVRYGGVPGRAFSGCLGVLVRKLQYGDDDVIATRNWDGESAWWIQFVNDEGPMWSYEEELTLVGKRN